LRQQEKAFSRRHAQVLAISVDSVAESKKFRKKLHATFPFLSDPGQKVAKQYTGTQGGGIDAPSVFLVDRRGRVRWRYLGNVTDRPAAAKVLEQLDLVEKAEKKAGNPAKDKPSCETLEEGSS